MFWIGMKSVRHYRALYIGTFVTMALGVALIGVAALCLAATLRVPSPAGGPSVTVAGPGGGHIFYRDAADMTGITTVLALSAVVSGFMTIMVVAGTFAFSIALRRRDLGLLRLLGATGDQVRRMILAEALAIAVPAAAAGCLAAAVTAPAALRALNHTSLTPVRLPAHGSLQPLLIAYGAGLVLAVLAALAAARRAARLRPAEALRDADLDTQVMTKGRWAGGGLALAAGLTMTSLAPTSGAVNATALAIFGTIALTVAAATLGPLYLPWLCGLPARWALPASGHLAVASVTTSRRRTSSLAAPALAITAVAGIMLGILETTTATSTADQIARTRGQLIVQPTMGTGLDASTLRRLAALPGVQAVSAAAPLKVVFSTTGSQFPTNGSPPGQLTSHGGADMVTAAAVDLTALAEVRDLSVVQGRLAPLTGDRIAVRQEFTTLYGVHAGSILRLHFFDGRSIDATVAAVVNGGADLPQIMLTPALAGAQAGQPPQATVLLRSAPASAAAAATSLAREARERGLRVRVIPVRQWYATSSSAGDRLQQLVLAILAGPASLFALVAIANTLMMAFTRRDRDITGLIVLGASKGQVRRMVTLEAMLVTCLGLAVAALLVSAGLAGYYTALRGSFLATDMRVPWLALAGLGTACLLTATVTSLLAVGSILRRPAMAMAATRE